MWSSEYTLKIGTPQQSYILKYEQIGLHASSLLCCARRLANSEDSDQTAPEEQSDQGLHCLHSSFVPIFRVNTVEFYVCTVASVPTFRVNMVKFSVLPASSRSET